MMTNSSIRMLFDDACTAARGASGSPIIFMSISHIDIHKNYHRVFFWCRGEESIRAWKTQAGA